MKNFLHLVGGVIIILVLMTLFFWVMENTYRTSLTSCERQLKIETLLNEQGTLVNNLCIESSMGCLKTLYECEDSYNECKTDLVKNDSIKQVVVV